MTAEEIAALEGLAALLEERDRLRDRLAALEGVMADMQVDSAAYLRGLAAGRRSLADENGPLCQDCLRRLAAAAGEPLTVFVEPRQLTLRAGKLAVECDGPTAFGAEIVLDGEPVRRGTHLTVRLACEDVTRVEVGVLP
jgi:hypothetical protein